MRTPRSKQAHPADTSRFPKRARQTPQRPARPPAALTPLSPTRALTPLMAAGRRRGDRSRGRG